MAVAHIKGVFLGPDGKVPMAELVGAMGHDPASPQLDTAIVAALA